jgi:hypothetical protein
MEVADRSICIACSLGFRLPGSMPGDAAPGIVASSQTDP